MAKQLAKLMITMMVRKHLSGHTLIVQNCKLLYNLCIVQRVSIHSFSMIQNVKNSSSKTEKENLLNPTTIQRIKDVTEPILTPEVSFTNITSNFKHLLKSDIPESVIIQNPLILTQNEEELLFKIDILKSIPVEITELVPLFYLNGAKLKLIQKHITKDLQFFHCTRIEYLASKFNCNKRRICELIVKHDFMGCISSKKLWQIMRLLEENNVSKEDILKDPCIFTYSPSTLEKRFIIFKNIGIEKVKPWEIRCSLFNLRRKFNREIKAQQILGITNKYVLFLSKRLNMSIEDVINQLNMRSNILYADIDKVNTVINLMHHYGYEVSEILYHQRLLSFDVEKLKKRLKQLHKIPGKKTITALYCSQSKFESYIQELEQAALDPKQDT